MQASFLFHSQGKRRKSPFLTLLLSSTLLLLSILLVLVSVVCVWQQILFPVNCNNRSRFCFSSLSQTLMSRFFFYFIIKKKKRETFSALIHTYLLLFFFSWYNSSFLLSCCTPFFPFTLTFSRIV